MKKILLVVIAVVVIGGVVWMGKGTTSRSDRDRNGTSTPSVSEVVKVSSTLSEYKNAELGFAVKYPSIWQNEETNSGVTFIIPIDKDQVSTVGTLQATIQAVSGTCAFPPVTTAKDRGTIKVGELNFNTISMSNTVQGRGYYNRMYSLQKGEVCYMFSFASITLSPESKKLTGSNATQAENNNKALIATSDTAFTNMVKSFTFVAGPQGVDESKVKAPAPVVSPSTTTPKKP
ncbi:MAG: hypothetical protein AAB381_03175 [Patescibacteria group bacterium]